MNQTRTENLYLQLVVFFEPEPELNPYEMKFVEPELEQEHYLKRFDAM